jgi:hypothetical protein
MPRKSPEDKLAELEQEKRQIEARIQQQKARLRVQERKDDTRRKIIAGALALEHARVNPTFGEQLKKLIREHVTDQKSRSLFEPFP